MKLIYVRLIVWTVAIPAAIALLFAFLLTLPFFVFWAIVDWLDDRRSRFPGEY